MSLVAPERDSSPIRDVSIFNIANGLTALRLLLVPVFAVFLLQQDGHNDRWRLAAAGVFAIAIITDKLDGDIARSRGLITDFGKMADPIADKALIGTALVGVSILGELPWWVTIVILAREIGVTLLRFWVIRYGVIAASRGGKAKTFIQSLAVWMYVLPLAGFFAAVRWWFMAIAIILTLVTGVDYIFRALRLRSSRKQSEPLEPIDGTTASAPDSTDTA
ncbi:MAG: CDP-diacylglycerol--glycerol-3-phosphate 3-phosphatidyltransferase [Antricoccus sp.]